MSDIRHLINMASEREILETPDQHRVNIYTAEGSARERGTVSRPSCASFVPLTQCVSFTLSH